MTPKGPISSSRSTPRWWPLWLILGVEAIGLLLIWVSPAIQRQQQVMRTGGLVVVSSVLLTLWLLAFSRLRWKTRGAVVLGCFAIVGVFAALFRFTGVTGDLVPRFTWRWKSGPASLAASSGTAAAGTTAPRRRLPDSFAGYPQFMGPARDGIVHGPPLDPDWKAHPPELLWRVPVGDGYSSFAILKERVIGQEQLGPNEVVTCRDLFTGATLWQHQDPTRYENSLGGIGPRTTPTVVGERVLVVGGTGHLSALDLSSGKLLWSRDIIRDASSQVPAWGVSCSPLVVNDLVIVTPGGKGHSLAAYHIDTGEPAWSAGDAGAGYSSPQLVTLLDEKQFLVFNGAGVAGQALADGHPLWHYPWTNAAQHVTDPRIVAPNRLLVSTGYGAGADLVEVKHAEDGTWSPEKKWHSQRLKSKFGSLILKDGFIYGLDDGRLTCLDLATSEPCWKGDRVGHGQLLLAGDLLVVTAEDGQVLLLEARAAATHELGRFETLPGKMWNPPALAPPVLVVRTATEAACYLLPLASEGPQLAGRSPPRPAETARLH